MANVYKKTSFKAIQNRNIQTVNENDRNSVSNILVNFVNYFKSKHLN
jgi:hypothetical protein